MYVLLWNFLSHIISGGQDKDRQRERLANIMAFGKDIDPKRDRKMARSRPPPPEDDDTQIDRFDECKS